ncbi:MAG: methyl-accepting chemotaxis protein [Pseudomonadota bacterium]
MRFRDVGLKTRFMLGAVFPMVIIVFLAASGIWSLRYVIDSVYSLDRVTKMEVDTVDIEKQCSAMESGLAAYLLTGEDKQLKSYESAWKAVSSQLAELKKNVGDMPDQMKALTDCEQSLENLRKHVAEKVIAARKGATDLKTVSQLYASMAKGEAGKNFDAIGDAMTSLRKTAAGVAAEQVEKGSYHAKLAETLVIYGLAVTIVLSLIVSYWSASRISKPLERAVGLAKSISQGDFSQRLNLSGSDEIGRLGEALDTMSEDLKNQTKQVIEAAQVLSASASEISTTVAQVAHSTAKTAASVTETNTTVEQVKQAAQLAREKAKKVAEAANRAVRTSIEGKAATDETSQRMSLIRDQMESIGDTVVRLSEHSRAIEEIISTVKDLADQSNLLAVNASIEASRAGEHGKGFAVVAHEIKTLADQSREATDQVRSILQDTNKWVSAVVMATEQGNKAVEAGVLQAGMAGNSIQDLADSVAASSQSASVIETTSEQQMIGVEQVAGAMANIVQAMHQNEQGTTQIERAARQLGNLGSQLGTLAGRYKL